MLVLLLLVALPLCMGDAAGAAAPAVAGYGDGEWLRLELEAIARSPHARLRSLGRTAGGRNVWLLRIGLPSGDERPGLLVLGGLDATGLYSTRLAVEMAKRLTAEADRGDPDLSETTGEATKDEPGERLVDRLTVYIIPLAAPDAAMRFFRQPYTADATNDRPRDDDGDGRIDEDPPNDLNGDGWITQMRVNSAAGTHIALPREPRLLVEADPKRGERGVWRVMTEGADDDGDGRLNEDPIGGVAFNRNFPFRYPYFERGAGEHQVSEPSVQAIADFVSRRSNLAVMFTFCPQENLFHQPASAASEKQGKIKTKTLAADVPYLAYLGELYRRCHGGSDAPPAAEGGGAFSDWVYFHMGRWSLASRGWWPPRVDDDRGDRPAADEANAEEGGNAAGEKPQPTAADRATRDEATGAEESGPAGEDDRRAQRERQTLQWLEQRGRDAFVDWTPVDHPDFPGQRVEVGGLKPFVGSHPPPEELEPLAQRHVEFLHQLAELLPVLAVTDVRATRCDKHIWRIEATVANRGYLPTMPKMGQVSGWPQPVQVELMLPRGAELLTGYARRRVERLTGDQASKQQWVVRMPSDDPPARLRIRAWAPSVGEAEASVELGSD